MTICDQDVTFQDAEDGSGDVVVQFSPQFLAEQGWRFGHVIGRGNRPGCSRWVSRGKLTLGAAAKRLREDVLGVNQEP
jgi:hypothetical protein